MRWSSGSVRRAARLTRTAKQAGRPGARCVAGWGIALGLVLSAGPGAGVASAERAYVTCQNGDALAVIDLDGGAAVQTWSVPGKPAGIAVGKGAVYTVAPDAKVVRRHDPDGTVAAEVTLDGGPIGTALDAARGRLFVSDWYNARLWVLDAATLEEQRALETGAAPAGVALSRDGRWLATADRDADRVSLFDAETLELKHAVTVGTRPFGLRFGPGDGLFVGNVGSNDVSVVDPVVGTVTATIPVGERPYGVTFTRDRAFVSNQYENTVSVIDLETLTEMARVEVGEYPEGIDTTADETRIVVANWFDNTLSIIDASTAEVLVSHDTCDGPRAFGNFLSGGGEE